MKQLRITILKEDEDRQYRDHFTYTEIIELQDFDNIIKIVLFKEDEVKELFFWDFDENYELVYFYEDANSETQPQLIDFCLVDKDGRVSPLKRRVLCVEYISD